MGKIKFHPLILGLIIVLSLTSCIPPGTPPDNQNTLETIVAMTLTAVAGDSPAPPPETDTPDAPAPVETEAPEEPTFTPPRALQVAYIKNGNVYIWTEGESSVGLTSTGDAMEVSISDDGQVIAYVRHNPTNEFAFEIWAVNTSGPTNARVLVSYDDFEALKAAGPHPDAVGLRPEILEWKPKTHQLAYSTFSLYTGPVFAPGEDMRMIDADTLEKTTIFDFHQGGMFYYSPDGNQVALVSPDHISIANADGSNLRSNILTFSPVITYSEYEYYPHPHWNVDSNALRVTIPPSDPLAIPLAPTTLWHIPIDGSPAAQLSSIPAIPFAWPDTAFSPNLDKVGYATSVGEPTENRRELHIANADGSEDTVFVTGVGVEFWHWTPDGTRFMYVIHDGANQGAYLGQLSGGSTIMASIPSTLNQMRWVDSSRFLYFQPNGNMGELRISDVDGQNHAYIDTVSDIFGSFDFTQ